MSNLIHLMHNARAELACPSCHNGPGIPTEHGLDECPACHGEHRNTATIELLEHLVDQATGYIRKVLR